MTLRKGRRERQRKGQERKKIREEKGREEGEMGERMGVSGRERLRRQGSGCQIWDNVCGSGNRVALST